MSDSTMIKNFIESRQDETDKNTLKYVKDVLAIEKEIKALKDDIKMIREEAKENQVNTKLANKAIAKLKYLLKNSDDTLSEEEKILETLQNDGAIISDISELISK